MTEVPKTPSLKAGKVSSRRLYSGKVLSLDLDVVRFPDGMTGELEMIRHPGASAVVPLLEGGIGDLRVLLIRQYRYAADGYVYEIPAGRLNAAESPEQCARRELREETGYLAGLIRPLTTIYTTPGFTDERIHIFEGEGLTEGPVATEVDEFIDLCPMLLSEAVEKVRLGEIVDGKTVIGLLLTNLLHGGK